MEKLMANLQQWLLSPSATVFTIAFAFLFFFFKLRTNQSRSSLPPSPPKLPVIGHLHQIGSLPHRSLQALSKKYGPLMLLHLGSCPTIVVSSEEVAREVMKTHDIIFASRPFSSMAKALMYDSSDVAFARYGEYWRQARKICVTHLLSIKRVQSFRSVREEEVLIFIEKIRESPNGLVNLSKMIVNLTNDVICRAAFGKKYFGEEGGEYDFGAILNEFVYLLGKFPIGDFIPWLRWVYLLNGLDARAKRAFKKIDNFLDRVLDEHLQHLQGKANASYSGEASNVVDVLLTLDEKDDMAGNSISKDNMIKGIILDMFAGGTDTTFTAIEWTMAELIKNPKAMRRVQDEVQQVTSREGIITEESINKMNYLKAVIKETFRMHAPVPLLVHRETTEDVRLQGYDIPAGTRVIVNAWAIGRDPKSWERPEEFDPDRFMNCDIDFRGQDFQLIPFGAGRRGCPGVGFAAALVELALVHLLHHFDWELPEGEELNMDEASGITVHTKSSLVLNVKPRHL